jgi:hypothetical protein
MLIVIDPAGELTTIDEPATDDAIRAAVGDFALIRLHGEPNMYAFVNDDGHPLGLDRNPIGACVLVSLGARPNPYVGPIAITGWDEPAEDTEIRDLSTTQAAFVRNLHGYVLRALAGEEVNFVGAESWSTNIRAYAQRVRKAPTPQLTVLSFGELADPQAAAARGGEG